MKIPRLPIIATLAIATLFSLAPASSAENITRKTYKQILEEIYKESDDGDAGDIKKIINKYLENLTDTPENERKLVEKIIKKLKKSTDKLDSGVSNTDLDRVFESAKNFIKKEEEAAKKKGNVNQGESPTQNG